MLPDRWHFFLISVRCQGEDGNDRENRQPGERQSHMGFLKIVICSPFTIKKAGLPNPNTG